MASSGGRKSASANASPPERHSLPSERQQIREEGRGKREESNIKAAFPVHPERRSSFLQYSSLFPHPSSLFPLPCLSHEFDLSAGMPEQHRLFGPEFSFADVVNQPRH